MTTQTTSNRLFNLLNTVQGRFAAEKAAKQAKLVASDKLSKNINTMAVNRTLWGELSKASALVEEKGEFVNRLKIDSLCDRFGYDPESGLDRPAFAKQVVKLVSRHCALTIRHIIENAKQTGDESYDGIVFDWTDATDHKVAMEVFAELRDFGAKLMPAPRVKKLPNGTINAVQALADEMREFLNNLEN